LIALGAAGATAGFVWQGQITPTSGYATGLLGPAILMCLGVGLVMPAITTTVTSGAGYSDAGLAAGLLNATRQVGGSLGLAVLATLAGTRSRTPEALTSGYNHAFLAIAALLALVFATSFVLPASPQTR
jgi:hypothetical protein